MKKLCELKSQENSFISKINLEDTQKLELLHIGVRENEPITCECNLPNFDISIYRVGSTVFSLRKKDAEYIEVSDE